MAESKSLSHSYNVQHELRILTILYGGSFIFRIAFGSAALLLIMILTNLQLELETLVTMVIMFSIAFSLVEGLVAGATGYLTDVMDARIVLVMSTGLGASVMLLYSLGLLLARDIIIFVAYLTIIHALHGIASSLKVTPTVAIIARFSSYELRARRMGIYDMILLLGRITGLALAGFFFGLFVKNNAKPYHALKAFPILAVLMVITGMIFWIFIPRISPEKKERTESLITNLIKHIGEGARIMFSKARRDLGVTWLMMSCLWGLAFTLGPFVLMLDLGIKAETTGYLTAFLTFVIAVPAPFWGYVADKIGRRKTALIGISGLIIVFIMGVTSYFLLGIHTNNPLFFVIISPGIFFISAIAPSFLGRLGDTALPGERGLTMSGYQFTTSVGEVLGVATGGIAYIVAKLLLAETPFAQYGGALGVVIMGLFYFLATILASTKLKSDEEILKWYEEEVKKRAEILNTSSSAINL